MKMIDYSLCVPPISWGSVIFSVLQGPLVYSMVFLGSGVFTPVFQDEPVAFVAIMDGRKKTP